MICRDRFSRILAYIVRSLSYRCETNAGRVGLSSAVGRSKEMPCDGNIRAALSSPERSDCIVAAQYLTGYVADAVVVFVEAETHPEDYQP